MRSSVLLAVAALLTCGAAARADDSLLAVREAFDSANTMYRAKHFDSSATVYEDVARRGHALDPDSVWTTIRDAQYNAACCRALLGQTDQACALLDSAVACGFWDANFMSLDADLKSLHAEPCYDSVGVRLKRLKDSLVAAVRDSAPLIYAPPNAPASAPLLVVLHTENSLPRDAVTYWRRVADTLGCVLVAPFGVHARSPHELSFGLTADTADRYVLAALGKAEKKYPKYRGIVIAGVAQGGIMAYQLAMKHPELVRGVVAINAYYNASYCDKFIPEVRRRGMCMSGLYDAGGAAAAASNMRAETRLRTARVNVRMLGVPTKEITVAGAAVVQAVRWAIDE